MPRNSETQMMSRHHSMDEREHARGNVSLYMGRRYCGQRLGYVYQAGNFLYGGFIWSDVYVTDEGEKVHFRTIQRKMKKEMGREDTKYGFVHQ